MSRKSLRSATVLGAALAAASALAFFAPTSMAGGSGPSRGPSSQPAARPVLPTVGFEATVCEVRTADVTAALEKLDAPALRQKAGSAAQFARALAEVGAARVLYHVQQALDLNDPDRISVGSSLPLETGRSGNTRTIMRQDVGMNINCRAYMPRDDAAEGATQIALHLELSNVVAGSKTTDDDPASPTFSRVVQTHAGDLRFDQPIVLVTLDAGGESPVAYVTLIRLTESK